MMNIHQTMRLWASLSPRLVRAAPDHLISSCAPDPERQADQNQASDRQRDHPILQVLHSSSDQRVSSKGLHV
jgi:hypothetical protein